MKTLFTTLLLLIGATAFAQDKKEITASVLSCEHHLKKEVVSREVLGTNVTLERAKNKAYYLLTYSDLNNNPARIMLNCVDPNKYFFKDLEGTEFFILDLLDEGNGIFISYEYGPETRYYVLEGKIQQRVY